MTSEVSKRTSEVGFSAFRLDQFRKHVRRQSRRLHRLRQLLHRREAVVRHLLLVDAHLGCSVPQIALAYVLNQPWDIYTLVGCANGREFADNAAALELPLTPPIRQWLEEGGERPF